MSRGLHVGLLSDKNVRPTGQILVLCHPERSEGSAFDSADALELLPSPRKRSSCVVRDDMSRGLYVGLFVGQECPTHTGYMSGFCRTGMSDPHGKEILPLSHPERSGGSAFGMTSE